jgi:CcmD family protein
MDQRNFQFLCYGLIAAWALVAVYLVVLAQRGGKLRRELERVKRMMEDRESRR